MRRLALLPAAIAFLLNPSACSDASEPEYQYGAEEMRAVVEGTWDLTLKTSAGDTAALALKFKQGLGSATAARDGRLREGPALLREAHACGTRTLIASAEACADATEMPLAVEFLSGDTKLGSTVLWDEGLDPTTLNGSFRVDSLVFYGGHLYLRLGATQLSAEIDSDGTTKSAWLVGMAPGEVTLERRRE